MVSFSGIVKSGISGAFVAAGYAAAAHPVTLVALGALPWIAHRASQCCSRRQEPEIRVQVRPAAPAAAVAQAQQVVNQPIDDEFQAVLEQSRQEHEYLEGLKRALRYEENRASRESGNPEEQPEEEFLQDLKANLKYQEDRLQQEMASRQRGSE